jgi:hypothetical protein
VTGQDLRAGGFHHLCVSEGAGWVRVQSEFGGDGDGEVDVECGD